MLARACRARGSAASPPSAPTGARTSSRAASRCRATACGPAVDAKPKTTTRLQRLDNIRAHPRASLLVDHYEEDWDELWWVRADGSAAVVEAGVEHDAAVGALVAKYPQYEVAPPRAAVIAVVVERWVGWSAAAV
jgi:PPOX class probable F420-dependent enzyme